MPEVHRIRATDGTPLEVVDELVGSGVMKDVYMAPDRSYVVAFYREPVEGPARDRLQTIIGTYRERIFSGRGGPYWEKVFRWPTHLVEVNGRTGIVVPAYDPSFYFSVGSRNGDMLDLVGREKEGKWFASAKHRKKYLAPEELGDWQSYFSILIKLSRAVRRLHMAGLAHSDLSYKNVLVDPTRGGACVIDIDGLVVPGKYPPDVVGTPDFIAPEVVRTAHRPVGDPSRVLPSIATDRHALAVLAYMYLLYRHPLKGRRVHDSVDEARDERLRMGDQALFIEHPDDPSNRPGPNEQTEDTLPWSDVDRLPYPLTGPDLERLFTRAFVDGLHDPSRRPTADEWETALVRTVDRLVPCPNPRCEQKWLVGRPDRALPCPFCGAPPEGPHPVLELFSSRGGQEHRPDRHQLMVHHNLRLYPWHTNRFVVPNERLEPHQTRPVGYFAHHQGRWVLVNQALPGMRDLSTDEPVPPRGLVELTEGRRILLSGEDGGRLIEVKLARP